MGKKSGIYLVVVFTLSVFCPVTSSAKESFDYVVTVGNETLTYVARPELGYVVKAAPDSSNVGLLAATLFMTDGDVRPIRGLDRQGIWVVENEYPAAENENTIGLLTTHSQVQYAAPLFSSNGETVAIIPEIVIHVTAGTDIEQVRDICERLDLAIIKPMEFTEVEYLLEVLGRDADAVIAAAEQLNEIPFVEWACPNTASRLHLAGQTVSAGNRVHAQDSAERAPGRSTTSGVFPNDEYFSEQWHLHNTGQSGGTPGADINAPEAWEITTGDPNIIIGVPDTGVDMNHPDLIDNLVPGYDFWEDDNSPDPSFDYWEETHGTACAGLAAAVGNNALGVTGVTWQCKIMPIRIETEDGLCSDADIATAFRWMASNGADVITNSWGYGAAVPITHSAIVDVTRPAGLGRGGKGCVILDASGNAGRGDRVRLIGRYPEVISVGATDHNDVLWSYSSHGTGLDLVAPSGGGSDEDWWAREGKGWLWTTDISGTAGYSELNSAYGIDPEMQDYTPGFSGTSGATPIAAGVAALILSIEPDLPQEEVRHFLTRSAKDLGDPGWDKYYGWGRVDARAALDMVLAKRADLNGDWKVDWRDFAVLAQSWKTTESLADIGPAPRPDGFVDVHDVILMGQYWLEEIPR